MPIRNRLIPSLVASLVVAVVGSTGQAAVLQPEADAFIRGGSNANSSQNGTTAQNLLVLPGNDLSFARKAYVRFDLSTVVGTAVDAELSFDFSFTNTASGGSPINIYAINDGVAGEDTWSESGLTWNNAPSNLTSGSTSAVASAVVASETVLVGSFSPTGSEIAGAQLGDGNTITFTIDATPLLPLINGDTNDAITFILTGNTGSNSPIRPVFASRENVGGGGAELTVIVPEPTSALGLIAGGSLLVLRRQQRA
ncbi:MAG: DNRLRE domain-containing protein [Planctomycetota bacterium]